MFVRTKRGADRLARNLKKEGFHAAALHGGMTQPARERALGRFATGDNDVLVATDVAARGLDLEHITHVINFDPPADEKDYVHRVAARRAPAAPAPGSRSSRPRSGGTWGRSRPSSTCGRSSATRDCGWTAGTAAIDRRTSPGRGHRRHAPAR